MMKYNRLVWDFMVTVIGEKFRNRDMSSARRDSIHEILDGSIRRVIERCKKAATTGAGLEPLDVDVLKLLYQI